MNASLPVAGFEVDLQVFFQDGVWRPSAATAALRAMPSDGDFERVVRCQHHVRAAPMPPPTPIGGSKSRFITKSLHKKVDRHSQITVATLPPDPALQQD